MREPIRVIQYGLGTIGRAVAQLVLEKRNMQLVGAVDHNPKLVGRISVRCSARDKRSASR